MSVTRALILLNIAHDKIQTLMGSTSNAGPQKTLRDQIIPLLQKIDEIERVAGDSLTPEHSAQIREMESQIRSIVHRFPESKGAGKDTHRNPAARDSRIDIEEMYGALCGILASEQKASKMEPAFGKAEKFAKRAETSKKSFLALLDRAEAGDRRALQLFLDMFDSHESFRFKSITVQDENGKRPVRSVDDLLLLKQTKPRIFATLFAKARGSYYRTEKAPWDPSELNVPRRNIEEDRDGDMRGLSRGMGKSVQPIKAMEYSRTDSSRNTLTVKNHKKK